MPGLTLGLVGPATHRPGYYSQRPFLAPVLGMLFQVWSLASMIFPLKRHNFGLQHRQHGFLASQFWLCCSSIVHPCSGARSLLQHCRSIFAASRDSACNATISPCCSGGPALQRRVSRLVASPIQPCNAMISALQHRWHRFAPSCVMACNIAGLALQHHYFGFATIAARLATSRVSIFSITS